MFDDSVVLLLIGYAVGGQCQATNPLTLTIPRGIPEQYDCRYKYTGFGPAHPKTHHELCDGQPSNQLNLVPVKHPWVVVFERLAR